MRCTRCRALAVIEVRRHNAAFCKECFITVFRNHVERSVDKWKMIGEGDRVMIAVSGGKDSLALWDVLLDLGFDATGLYMGLGIGDYSDRSAAAAEAFAGARSASLIQVDLRKEHGFDIPTAQMRGPRSACAVCGLSKRYISNRAALQGGYDVIATGHNLDDEAATLLGNTLRWNTEFISRQSPVLPAKDGMVKKVKPLHRISELETAAYAFLRGIDYVIEECPLVAGNTQLRYKEAMNALEARSPGTKAQFFLGYLDRGMPLFEREDKAALFECARCGQPTTGEFCAFCRAKAQILGDRLSPPPADLPGSEELSDEVLPVELYGQAVP